MRTQVEASAPSRRGVPSIRWWIALLLGFGILVNYFDRLNLTVAGPALRKEFGIDDVAFGYLLSGFAWTYAILQIPIGVVLDRAGVLTLGRINTFLWSLASFITAFSSGFAGIFGSRLLLGVAETPAFPVSSKATGYWFPLGERGLATAIFDAAAKLSSAIGVPFVALIATMYGWRGTFIATGILSFVYFVLFAAFYRNPSQAKFLSSRERDYIVQGGAQPEGLAPSGAGASLGYLLRQRKVWGLTLGFAAYGYTFYLLLTWLPAYFIKTQHWDVLKAGLYASIPWIFATITDLIVGGWLVDYLIQRGADPTRVRRTLIVIGFLMGLTIIGVAYTKDPNVAVIWQSIALSGLAFTAPIGWSIPAIIAPRGSVGTVGAIMNFLNNVMGIVAPIVTGYIVAGTGSFAAAFITAAIILAFGIVAYIWILGRIEPIPEPDATPVRQAA